MRMILIVLLVFHAVLMLNNNAADAAKSSKQSNLKYQLQPDVLIPPQECRNPPHRHGFIRTSLSTDGKTLAVGCPTGYNGEGGVTVYAKSPHTGKDEWFQQQGPTLHGNDDGFFRTTNEEGNALALSRNGHVLAVSAIRNSTTGYYRGLIFIYNRNPETNEWVQEAVLFQENPSTNESSHVFRFGSRLGLSDDGKTLATIGTGEMQSYNNQSSNLAVVIFTRNNQGVWSQQGPALQPSKPENGVAFLLTGEITLSNDGNTVAATSTGLSGMGYTIQLFQRNKAKTLWKQGNPAFVQVAKQPATPGYLIQFARGTKTLLSLDSANKTMTSFELFGKRNKLQYKPTHKYTYANGIIATFAADATGSTVVMALQPDPQLKKSSKLMILKRSKPRNPFKPFQTNHALVYHPIRDATRMAISGNGKRFLLANPFDFTNNGTIEFYQQSAAKKKHGR